MLDPAHTLEACGLHDGDTVIAVAQQPQMAATYGAFALWCCSCGKLVTWIT